MSISLNAEQITHNREALAMAPVVGGQNPAAIAAANRILSEFANEMGLGVQRVAAEFARNNAAANLAFADAGHELKNAMTFDGKAGQRLIEGNNQGVA